jgi:DNA polymerase I-like protein with 3'-5' exonuclease and polymerase domains
VLAKKIAKPRIVFIIRDGKTDARDFHKNKNDGVDSKISFLKAMLLEVNISPYGCGFISLKDDDEFSSSPATTYVSLGKGVLPYFNLKDDSEKMRGSVFNLPGDSWLIPTFDPIRVLRSDLSEKIIMLNDLTKARKVADGEFKKPEERFVISYKFEKVMTTLEKILKFKERYVGLDIETTGLNPDYASVRCIGLSWSESDAIVIPYLRKLDSEPQRCFSVTQETEINAKVQEIFNKHKLVIQNAMFDKNFLESKGFRLECTHDTMLLHHAIHPELRHNLGFITSLYGFTPYWKDVKEKDDKTLLTVEDKKLFEYNARDCVTLLQILPGLLDDIDTKAFEVYESVTMKMINPILRMQRNGLLLNVNAMKKWKKDLEKESASYHEALVATGHIGNSFTYGDHMIRHLFYGVVPPKAQDKVLELAVIKNKTTKKFKELQDYVKCLEEITPLTLPYSVRKELENGTGILFTDKGGLALDNSARIAIKQRTLDRLDAITFLQKPQKCDEEKKGLLRTLKVVEAFDKKEKLEKLISTYTKFSPASDGRIHTSIMLHGTVTGRLSSNNPNMQNLPASAKIMFDAAQGYRFCEADYENLELRILAYLSDDEVMMKMFEDGLNVHDENTKMIFGIDKDHPQWEMLRKIEKMYIFGRNYGGGLSGMLRRMYEKESSLRLTLRELREIDTKYYALHPAYARWVKEVEKEVTEKRCLTNEFGRVRIFTGRLDEALREGKNFKIQSTAADIVNKAIIKTDKWLMKDKVDAKFVLTVHDSIMLEYNESIKKLVHKNLKEIMEAKVRIGKHDVLMKVEIKDGTNWKNLAKI